MKKKQKVKSILSHFGETILRAKSKSRSKRFLIQLIDDTVEEIEEVYNGN